MDKLKPCPFCGRKPKITDLGQVKVLSCEFSGCSVHPRICYTWRPEKEKEAIELWNRRTEPPESEVQDEAKP